MGMLDVAPLRKVRRAAALGRIHSVACVCFFFAFFSFVHPLPATSQSTFEVDKLRRRDLFEEVALGF